MKAGSGKSKSAREARMIFDRACREVDKDLQEVRNTLVFRRPTFQLKGQSRYITFVRQFREAAR